ncbi:MAG TPA: flippase activity-associated protein Agl23 [Methanomicrobiales archaeon]|nr:flippase activity-associated protein Agl23 [Methanomicrobiales archaeon]
MSAAGNSLRHSKLFSFETGFFLILIVAFVLRFAFLDLKLFHHDEAIHAWFSYQLLTQGTYTYDPSYHGPLLYFVTASMFSLFGASDLVGRLVPALLGFLMVPMVYAIYRLGYLNKAQTLVAGLFVAISPDLVYFSRFLRHDIFMLFFSFLLLVALLYYFERGKTRYFLLAAFALGGGLCCKEEMPLIALIFGSFFLFSVWRGRFTLPRQWKWDVVLGVLVVVGIMAVLYSSFGAQPEVLVGQNFNISTSGWYKAIDHWMEMHNECRLCGPFYYYLPLFLLYELPIMILAVIGTIQFIGKETSVKEYLSKIWDRIHPPSVGAGITTMTDGIPQIEESSLVRETPPPSQEIETESKQTEFFAFSIYWMVLSMGMYAYIGEKVPWLIIPQLLPMIFVAVYAMSRKKAFFAIASIAFLAMMTWHVAFVPVDINEPIVQVQNSEQLRDVMAQIDAADHVAVASDSYWPLPWYYRGEASKKLVYYARRVDENTLLSQDFDLVIAHDTDSYASLPGFTKKTYHLNYWFDYYNNENRLPEYYVTREGPMGSMNIDVFTRAAA